MWSGDIIGDLGGMKVVGCGGWIASLGGGLTAVRTLPNPEAHGDSKMALSSGLPLRLFPLEKPLTGEANSSSNTKLIGNDAWATGRGNLPAISILGGTGFLFSRFVNSQGVHQSTAWSAMLHFPRLLFCRLIFTRRNSNSFLHGPTCMNPQQPVSFPDWKAALAQSDLSPVVQAVYSREILTLLHHCKKCHSPVTVAFIKLWLAGPRLKVRLQGMAAGADQAREALRWFYRNAPKAMTSDGECGQSAVPKIEASRLRSSARCRS